VYSSYTTTSPLTVPLSSRMAQPFYRKYAVAANPGEHNHGGRGDVRSAEW
jgi:hypothetical protein